jgi:hypothetical protein
VKDKMMIRPILFALALATAVPAIAGNTLVPPGTPVAVAKSRLTVTPASEWNRLGARPGRSAETWTLDGDTLNDLTFYGGIESGKPIIREVSKKQKPLPTFSSTMLLNDVPALLEQSYRIALDTPLVELGTVEPASFGGAKGVHFSYRFTRPEEDVQRNGEAWATIADGRLYMIAFEAPALHFFDAAVGAARSIVATAKLGPQVSSR